jgi:hypothetical protein
MKSQTRTAIALFGGAATLAIAVGVGIGDGGSISSATPATPTQPAPSSVVAPASSPQADAPNGCIHGANCGPATPKPQQHP